MKPSDIEREFEAGERILTAGETCRDLFVIREGEVRIARHPPEQLGPGALFGELGAILGRPAAFDAVAESEVTVLALDAVLLTKLCAEPGEFSLRVIRHLAERLEAPPPLPEQPPGDASGLDSPELQRVVAAILERVIPAAGPPGPATATGDLRDLAAAAELPLEETYRLIQRLFAARYLRLDQGELCLLEPEALERLGPRALTQG